MRHGARAAALFLPLLVACSPDQPTSANGVVVRDSLGIAIVENLAPEGSSDAPFGMSAEPAVRLGGDDRGEAHRFFGVVFAGRLSDGRILVADGGSRTLRWFDPAGSHLTSAGAHGDGPGEFRQISAVGVTDGDTVVVWDGPPRRLSLLVDGRFVRDVRFEAPDPWGPASVRGVLPDGRLAVVPVPIPGDEVRPGVYRPEVPVWLVSAHGTVERELGRFPSTAVELRPATTPGAVIRGIVPFGSTTLVAVGPDRLVVGDNARYELWMYGPRSGLESIVRLPGASGPVTADDLAQELERRLEGAPPVDEIREGIRANFEATPVPDTKPYYDRLMVDAEGRVWVRRAPETWDVISPEGRWLGSARTPPGLQVTQFGSRFLVGVWTDAFGVEEVHLHELAVNLP